ncbi:MAG TPA: UvrD-helicase domain-containing protein [Verrucomicrobiae bacterium]|nr:UvrD-helicase domain-containing protein [Verrucomicrobiae bacterium]
MSRDYVLEPFRPEVNLQIDYARELNPQQLAAVTAPPGPALVIAGAGSGKTRTLTYRVAYLLEQGIPADRILLLTFTNKAAGEMMRRVAGLLGQELASLWGGTFHSIGARILRSHADLLGYRRDFTILDRDDAKDLIKACIADAGIETKGSHFPKPEVLCEIFSLAANTHTTTDELLERQFDYFEKITRLVADVQKRYTARKRATNAMDFDDLLALWLRLLREHTDVREHYQRRFQFVLVDEYQDTNRLQSDLIDLLAERHHNIMVVGDDAQSIYAWRGANFANILQFPKRFPDAKVFKIETNYRSTPEILRVANAAIAANRNQFTKTLTPARKSGLKPALVACMDATQQSAFIAQRVTELHDEGVSMNQVAVLYRSHFHALELQLELTKRNIPFSITSGIRFFEQAHIKDATAYLRLVANPQDELAFKRLVQLLPGIAAKGADKLWQVFHSRSRGNETQTEIGNRKSEIGNMSEPPNVGSYKIAPALQVCSKSVPAKATKAWVQFVETVSQLEDATVRQSAAKMLRVVIDAGYDDYLKENFANYRTRLEDLEQLAVFAYQFESVEDFLTQLALLTNVEAEDDQAARDDTDKIRLSTIHQAKGLEFDAVFVIMLCDGLFPSSRSMESDEGEEEERRLFYVAITRAKTELYLSYPLMRASFSNSGGDGMQQPSRFLSEIPRGLLNEWNLRSRYG